MSPTAPAEPRSRYSEHEITQIYALARLLLENGDLKRAEVIARGLVSVAPEFAPGWLALCYIQSQSKNFEDAVHSADRALKADPDSAEAELFLVACLLTTGDLSAAGTHLGGIAEKVDSGALSDPQLVRFYKIQLARFQSRGR